MRNVKSLKKWLRSRRNFTGRSSGIAFFVEKGYLFSNRKPFSDNHFTSKWDDGQLSCLSFFRRVVECRFNLIQDVVMENRALKALKEKGLTITDLAKQIKYNRPFISEVLNKKVKATPRVVNTLIDAIGGDLTYDDFLVSKHGHH